MSARTIVVPLLSISAVCLFAVALAPTKFAASSSTESAFLYTAAKSYDPLAWVRGEERFSAGAAIFLHEGPGRRSLVPSFAASTDPAVSFDGSRVLFAGKQKTSDPWQIWEISLAGGEPHRISSCAEDCIRPFYLPEDRVVYARRSDGRFVIEAATLADGKALPLTYGLGSSLPTDVLRDGRILFEAISPFGANGTPELYTVYSDGSGVESYRCDHGKARLSGKQVSSGDIVFASASGLARFTSALAQEVRISAPAGEYAGDVVETASGDWLLSWRRDAKSPFQLMHWTPGPGALRPALAEPNVNVIEPALVGERDMPKRHPSGLHDWPNANLLCLNAYTSKYKFAEGSIHSARLYTRDTAGSVKLLGTAPVESDGSFFIQVPTERPLQIELLDGAGKTLKRQAGWFWMRRGEQRACVGCHSGPETSPENAVPMVLQKSTTPVDLTGTATNNASGGP